MVGIPCHFWAIRPSNLSWSTVPVVTELEKVGDRIHYELISGSGPKKGWATRTSKVALKRQAVMESERLQGVNEFLRCFDSNDTTDRWPDVFISIYPASNATIATSEMANPKFVSSQVKIVKQLVDDVQVFCFVYLGFLGVFWLPGFISMSFG